MIKYSFAVLMIIERQVFVVRLEEYYQKNNQTNVSEG